MFQISPHARRDLVEIWLYIAERASDQRADKLIDEIESTCSTLAASPFIGRARDEIAAGIRSLPVSSYIIFYDILDSGDIVVQRVLHQRRDLPTLF